MTKPFNTFTVLKSLEAFFFFLIDIINFFQEVQVGPRGAGHQGEKLPEKPTDRDAMTRAHVTQPGRKKDVSLSPFLFFFFPRRLAKMLIAAITIRFIGLCYEIKKAESI